MALLYYKEVLLHHVLKCVKGKFYPSTTLPTLEKFSCHTWYRAIAAGPVSTGSLFPSVLACLSSPINVMAQGTPTQAPHAHNMHIDGSNATCFKTCEMATEWKSLFWDFLMSFFLIQVIPLGSQTDAGKVDIYTCRCLSSGCRFGPKMVSEALRASKFQAFTGGTYVPPDTFSCCVLTHGTCTSTSNLMATALWYPCLFTYLRHLMSHHA